MLEACGADVEVQIAVADKPGVGNFFLEAPLSAALV